MTRPSTFRLASVQYPNGQSSAFSYFDNLGDQRLQTLWHTNSAGDTLSRFDYSYDVEGQITTWTRQADAGTPNVWAVQSDRADQLLAVTVHSNTIAGAILKQFAYGYDQAANRTSKQIQGGPGVPPTITTAYYNNLNQLTNTTAGGPMLFSGRLDKPGTVTVAGIPATMNNQTTNFVGYANVSTGINTVQIVAQDYNNNSRTNNYQIVVSDNGVARTLLYDLNGNLTNMTTANSTNTYAWDAANRLIRITQMSGSNSYRVSQFTYDGLGRRVEIDEFQNNNLVIGKKFVWCGTELCEERDSSGANVTKRFFPQGEQIAGTSYFFTRDHLGSVREMTDSSGTIQVRYDYDPYGRRTKVQGDLDADFGFTGLYFHPTSGLQLALYRTYDTGMGRWLNRDPLGEAGGVNLYDYVGNNPINEVDPLGLEGNPISSTIPGMSGSWNSDPYGAGGSFYGPGVSYKPPCQSCMENCLNNYPFLPEALAMTPLGLLNLKDPITEMRPGASPFTSLDRRLGARIVRGGATVTRGTLGVTKYVGRAGTAVAAGTAFGVGYTAGAIISCSVQCAGKK